MIPAGGIVATVNGGGESDVLVGVAYDEVRNDARRRVAELKGDRRVSLGPVTVVFENRATMTVALEEALRAERISDPGAAAAQSEAFGSLMPTPGEFCACVYVDASDQAELAGRLTDLAGLGEALHLEVDGSMVTANAGGDSQADQLSAVTPMRFQPDAGQRDGMARGAPILLILDHPRARARVELSETQRGALLADLTG